MCQIDDTVRGQGVLPASGPSGQARQLEPVGTLTIWMTSARPLARCSSAAESGRYIQAAVRKAGITAHDLRADRLLEQARASGGGVHA